MTKMFVSHLVADFETWKAAFDSMHNLRADYGCVGEHIYRGLQNPNEILIVTEWPGKQEALRYGQSNDLKEGMQKAGVISAPAIHFSEN